MRQRRFAWCLGIVALIGVAAPVAAERIFKSIDADGNITYSTVPPENLQTHEVRTMTLDPAPDDARRRAAEERARAFGGRASHVEQRQQQERRQRADQAERARAVDDARRDLDRVERAYQADWRNRLHTGLEPDEELAERRRQAKRELEKAQKEVREGP